MKLWIDDLRPAPEGYIEYKAINPALRFIRENIMLIDVIDLDHDAGDFRRGGKDDYIVILNELERLSKCGVITCNHINFRFHSMNPVGVENMRRIIERNGWKEVK